MPIGSPKSKEAESSLPTELQPVYRQMVEQYEFLRFLRYGHGYVAYQVLADMVLAGWRPSADLHPSSRLAGHKPDTAKKGNP
jgi:hypothetical protein